MQSEEQPQQSLDPSGPWPANVGFAGKTYRHDGTLVVKVPRSVPVACANRARVRSLIVVIVVEPDNSRMDAHGALRAVWGGWIRRGVLGLLGGVVSDIKNPEKGLKILLHQDRCQDFCSVRIVTQLLLGAYQSYKNATRSSRTKLKS